MSEKERNRIKRFRFFMSEYHAARHAYVLMMESLTAMYAWEVEQFKLQYPPVTFKQWLLDTTGIPR